ncbi:MAG: (d)CMP kinase [Maricaulaceae bacterium]|nr:(d)CMP kinase [Maricaulaceae bacterium]
MIIAVDGQMAAGKGTIARELARRFRLPHLDTGSLYRAVGAMVLKAGGDPADPEAAIAAAKALDPAKISEKDIRTQAAAQAASKVAAIPEVRAALYDLQRDFAMLPGGALLDGRDIGTVICPEADVKIYVTAETGVRARRRWLEIGGHKAAMSYEDVLAQLRERDARDAGRASAPMRPADDAILLDTSHLSIDAAIAAAVRIVQNKTGAAPVD